MAKSLKKPNPEVTEFANALKNWAEEEPGREQKERLLRWLLSRCESRGFTGPIDSSRPKDPEEPDKFVIRRVDINEVEIVKAVERALTGYNPDLPTSGWVRGGPFWPRAYGDMWPRSYGDLWPRS